MNARKQHKSGKGTTAKVNRALIKPFNFNRLPKVLREHTSRFFSMDDYQNGTLTNKELYRLFHGRDFWLPRFEKHFSHYNINYLLRVKDLDWSVAFRIVENEYFPDLDPNTRKLIYHINEGHTDVVTSKIKSLEQITVHKCILTRIAARSRQPAILNHFYKIVATILMEEVDNVEAATGRSLLHWAIDCLQPIELIHALIAKGYNINHRTVNSDNDHPLHIAVRQGYTQCVALLIEKGSAINWAGIEGYELLHIAASRGHVECVRLLLKMRVPLSDLPPQQTALMRAAIAGNSTIIRLLVEHGAQVNIVDEAGKAAHHYAARHDYVECLRILLDHGAGLELASHKKGYTPLLYAARHGSLESLRLLLNSGANINAKLDTCWSSALILAASNGHEGCVALLLEHKAKPNQVSIEGENALFRAVAGGYTGCVRLLLAAGVYPNKVSKVDGNTPLIEAARHGLTECFELLLAHKAKVDVQNVEGHTALISAAMNGYHTCVKLLLDAGANPHITYKDELYTAIFAAAHCNHPKCVQVLLDHGVYVDREIRHYKETVIFTAIKEGSAACVEIFLQAGANPNHLDSRGYSPLFWAIISNKLDCAKLLIDHGANINLEVKLTKAEIQEKWNKSRIVSSLTLHNFIQAQSDSSRIKVPLVTLAKILERMNFVALFHDLGVVDNWQNTLIPTLRF